MVPPASLTATPIVREPTSRPRARIGCGLVARPKAPLYSPRNSNSPPGHARMVGAIGWTAHGPLQATDTRRPSALTRLRVERRELEGACMEVRDHDFGM